MQSITARHEMRANQVIAAPRCAQSYPAKGRSASLICRPGISGVR